MKILYFPGIRSIIDKDYDLAMSCKLVHLKEISECDVFDYHSYELNSALKQTEKYDVLFGSSFGGFFAFNLALRTDKKCICVNPSLYLDKRISALIAENPDRLSFLKTLHLSELIAQPKKQEVSNIHVLMNMDDDVLNAEKILSIARIHHANTYEFEKGGHDSTNFIGEMLPLIKLILAD